MCITSKTKFYTLVFVKNDGKLLLGRKKRGFGVGKWNGYGGKIEQNETIAEAAIRELDEESGLKITEDSLKYLGHVTYEAQKETRIVYIFTVKDVEGEPSETDEMKPKWFGYEELPYAHMWPDAKEWFHLVIDGCCLRAVFVVDNDNNVVRADVCKLECVPDSVF